MRVLLVEDEFALAAAMARGLAHHGITADVAATGEAALERLEEDAFDVIVLDRRLPGISGDDVCRRLRERGADAPILMLTAVNEVEDRVAGLSAGADDYLAKPAALVELVARLEALDRRRGRSPVMELAWGELSLDRARRCATRGGREIVLTAREFELLELLVRADGTAVSLARLERALWGPGSVLENTVRATILRLRRKLGEPAVIETVTGLGYRLR